MLEVVRESVLDANNRDSRIRFRIPFVRGFVTGAQQQSHQLVEVVVPDSERQSPFVVLDPKLNKFAVFGRLRVDETSYFKKKPLVAPLLLSGCRLVTAILAVGEVPVVPEYSCCRGKVVVMESVNDWKLDYFTRLGRSYRPTVSAS